MDPKHFTNILQSKLREKVFFKCLLSKKQKILTIENSEEESTNKTKKRTPSILGNSKVLMC